MLLSLRVGTEKTATLNGRCCGTKANVSLRDTASERVVVDEFTRVTGWCWHLHRRNCIMIFTVTERGVFRRCRRQAVLTSKNGRHLGRLFPPLNLSVGTIVHRAHQLWLENPHKSMHDCAMDASVEASNGVRERYLKQVGAYPSDDEMV
jgi:hypothetical protein